MVAAGTGKASPTDEQIAFGARLRDAMGENGSEKIVALAEACEISRQAAKLAFDGKRTFGARANSFAARFLKVDPDWLATGEGTPNFGREPGNAGMPFSDLKGPEVQLVTFYRLLKDRQDLQLKLVTYANSLAANGNGPPSPADPYSGRKPPVSDIADSGAMPFDSTQHVAGRKFV